MVTVEVEKKNSALEPYKNVTRKTTADGGHLPIDMVFIKQYILTKPQQKQSIHFIIQIFHKKAAAIIHKQIQYVLASSHTAYRFFRNHHTIVGLCDNLSRFLSTI